MTTKVKLINGNLCEVSSQILSLTSLFVEDEGIVKINTNNVKTAKKISDFAVYYSGLNKQQKQYITNPTKLPNADESVKLWYRDFSDMEPDILVELLELSSTLDIKPLMELCCYMTAELIRDKSTEEIGNLLNIKCDYTEEELKELSHDIAWTRTL